MVTFRVVDHDADRTGILNALGQNIGTALSGPEGVHVGAEHLQILGVFSYTFYPGEWITTLNELSQWFRTASVRWL